MPAIFLAASSGRLRSARRCSAITSVVAVVFLLVFKELVNVRPTPLDEALEFWKVWDVSLLHARQRIEWDVEACRGVAEAHSSAASFNLHEAT